MKDIKPMTPLKCLDKVGFATNVFTSEHSEEIWIVFESAESITRSPIRQQASEFIPVVADSTTMITLKDIADDVELKKERVRKTYPDTIKNALRRFENHDGLFVKRAITEDESFILHFENNGRILVESVMGEILLHFHPRLYKKIDKEEAISLAQKFSEGIEQKVLDRLDDYLEKCSKLTDKENEQCL